MTIRKILLMGLTVMLLASGNVWAGRNGNSPPRNSPPPRGGYQAPEIDATSGTNAIALLVGALLLAGERFRSRRS